jgi:hypothetical protein
MRPAPGAVCYDVGVRTERVVRVGTQFVRHMVPAIIRPAHALWNQVIGFIFLSFGGIFGISAVRYAIKGDTLRLTVAGLCTLIMAWYGITSFLKARRISRS